MFVVKIDPIVTNGVYKIGGKDIHPKGVDAVFCYWTDGEGQLHQKNKMYSTFLNFQLIVFIATAMTYSMQDGEVTWILTKSRYSVSTWYFGNYTKKFVHSEKFSKNLK